MSQVMQSVQEIKTLTTVLQVLAALVWFMLGYATAQLF
jgi:hypothetical protein